MTYALVIVEKPEHGWPDDMHRPIRRMPNVEGVSRLNESAWLIHVDIALKFLSGILHICQTHDLVHHVAFFEQKPSFVTAPQKPA